MKNYLSIVACFMLLVGCKVAETNSPNVSFTSYNRKALLQNVGKNIIVPSYKLLNDNMQSLYSACSTFTKNPTQQTLDSAQLHWKIAASAWKKCELFNFGPSANLIDGYYASIDYHPTNSTVIEENMFALTTIDSAYIANKGSSVKGLPALEYLLFDRTNGDSYILGKYTGIDYLSTKRREYVNALCINLKTKSNSLFKAWDELSGNYLTTFINNDGNEIGSSIGLLVNQLAYLTDVIKGEKINAPLGSNSGGVVAPDKVEAPMSESSINHITDNLNSIKLTFNGSSSENTLGIDDLLNYLKVKSNDTLLSEKVNLQIIAVQTVLDNLEKPLQKAIVNQPNKVVLVSDELTKLIALFKVDVATALGVSITFTSNDGD